MRYVRKYQEDNSQIFKNEDKVETVSIRSIHFGIFVKFESTICF